MDVARHRHRRPLGFPAPSRLAVRYQSASVESKPRSARLSERATRRARSRHHGDMPDDPFGDAFGPLGPLVGRLLGDLGSLDLGDLRPPPGARGTHGLNRFGRDLTADARAGLLDPVIGRDDEIDQVIEVLARRTKNNPVLLGDPGVGKTAIVEGIAKRIADGEVPAALREVRLVALDLAGMVAGTKYRGEFEERLTGLISEITAAGPSLIVFVDELHQVVGAGSAEGAPMDAGTMLKPALARGELRLIGATTLEEYRRHIEKDAALERRFEPVNGARADRRADRGDPPGSAGALRDPPRRHDHRRGAAGGGRAGRPLRPRPVPARQGHRPCRPRRRPCGAAHAGRGRVAAGRAAAPRPRRGRRRRGLRARDGAHPRAGEARRGAVAEQEAADHRRRHRPDRGAAHRHPGRRAGRGRARPAAAPRGAAAPAHRRAGRGRRGGRRRRAQRPGRARPPGAAGRLVPVPRPHRRGQDRAGPGAGRGAVRLARQARAAGPVRVHRPLGRHPHDRRPARARRLRGRGPAHRGRAPRPLHRGAAGRDREGAPRGAPRSCSRCSTPGGSPTRTAARSISGTPS